MIERDIAAVGEAAPTVAEVYARTGQQASDLFEARWKDNLEAHPYAIEMWPHLDALIGAFAGRPAVVIGTGPSLTRSLPDVAAISRKAVTVACPSAVKYCVEAGFAPLFVPFVESTDVEQIRVNFPAHSNVLLDFRANDAYYDIEAAQRFVFGHETDDYAKQARKLCARKTILPESPSTLGTCFAIAVLLGCNPIVFVGADFSFDGDTAHPTGHYAEGFYPATDCWTFAGKDGLPAKANWVMLAHRDWLQNWIPRYKQMAEKAGRELAVVDATPRGLGVPGAQPCASAVKLLDSCAPLSSAQLVIDHAALSSTMFAHALLMERACLIAEAA